MPLYYFNLFDGAQTIADPWGEELPDRKAAELWAYEVARELMQNTSSALTRDWCLEICDASSRLLFSAPFVRLDPRLDHLDPQSRCWNPRLSRSSLEQ